MGKTTPERSFWNRFFMILNGMFIGAIAWFFLVFLSLAGGNYPDDGAIWGTLTAFLVFGFIWGSTADP